MTYLFKPEETFQVEFADETKAECTIMGYDLFVPEDKNVMVLYTFPDKTSYKNLIHEDVLLEMKRKGGKLYQLVK